MSIRHYDAIIIGAGPAGLFCAVFIVQGQQKVLVLEKNAIPGKKLLITGSGQCNITHEGEIDSFFTRYGDHGRLLKPALLNFTNQDVVEFFTQRGLPLIPNEDGKFFPRTKRAKDILDLLQAELTQKGVQIYTNSPVESITCEKQSCFTVSTGSVKYTSDFLVISTGGLSYPSTGSTGDGYLFARAVGHTVSELHPALTPLKIKDYQFADLTGLTFRDAGISLWNKNKKVSSWCGDVLLTHQGISGPAVLNISRYVRPGDRITISFIPHHTIDTFRREFSDILLQNGRVLVKTILRNYQLPKRLIEKLLEFSSIPDSTCASHLNKTGRENLIQMLTAYPMIVESPCGYSVAMTTCGGVSPDEINPKTMESRVVKNLYFAGEVLDIDGDEGGYNLQAAISTGVLAGQSICKKIAQKNT